MDKRKIQGFILILIMFLVSSVSGRRKKPHIIFILADDMGWNDISFHGSDEIPTPNIDALAYSGVILNRYYGQQICTPSRSAFLTGNYPIHNGMQHMLISAAEPRGLALNQKLLPEYLNELGYESHIVGKWHLGFHKKEYTPTYRGFKSHLGYWNGYQDYYDHSVQAKIENKSVWGLDMRRNMNVAWDLHGKYSTDIYTNESIRIIDNHNDSHPLFLFVSQIAPHSGSDYNPDPVPSKIATKFSYISDYNRKRYAGMMYKLDEGVGRIIKALSQRNFLKDSIIVFSSDNGGPVRGYMGKSFASNWPLKGSKGTLWEGGVRLAALIWSPLLKYPGTVSNDLFHITDWIPTFLAAAGGPRVQNIDGINQWSSLTKGLPSKRSEILLNIDPIEGTSALIHKSWKIIKGVARNGAFDSHFGPSGRSSNWDKSSTGDLITSSLTASLLSSTFNITFSQDHLQTKRLNAVVTCKQSTDKKLSLCFPEKKACLFNIEDDPCEFNNIADRYPSVIKMMENILKNYEGTAVAPRNKPDVPWADPANYEFVWTNFDDLHSSYLNSTSLLQ